MPDDDAGLALNWRPTCVPSLTMPRLPHVLTGCLALVALSLGVVVWQQHGALQLARAQVLRPLSTDTAVGPRALTTGVAVAGVRPLARPTVGPRVMLEDDESLFAPGAKNKNVSMPKTGALARLMGDPKFVRALSVHQEGTLDGRYAELFRRLNLSPEELVHFKRLLVEKDSVALDVVAVSQEATEPLPPRIMEASIRAAQAQVDDAIRASLGNDRYALYAEFVGSLPQRAMVARLEQRLSYTGSPLQPAQTESLVRIFAQHAPADAGPRPAKMPMLMDASSPELVPVATAMAAPAPMPEEAIVKAHEVLTVPQVAALRAIQREIEAAALTARQISEALPILDYSDHRPAIKVLLQ